MPSFPLSLYKDLFERAPKGIILSDKKMKIREANPAAIKIFGYDDKRELLEHSISDLLPREKRKKVRSALQTPTKHEMGKEGDMEGIRKNGSVFPIELHLNHHILESGEKLVISFVVDVSELAEDQDITEEKLLKAREEERNRLAKELHDGITQLLTGIHLNLGGLSDQEDPEIVKGLEGLTNEAIEEARALSQNLMPPDLYEHGPVPAIRKMLDRLERTSGIKTEFSVPDEEERHPSFLEVTLFRIIQECISNVMKHSAANCLKVRIKRQGDEGLELRVEDDGKGYDRTKMEAGKREGGSGMGLGNIQDRINAFNGSLKILSEPGRGTLIQGFLPFNKGGLSPKEYGTEIGVGDQ